MDVTLIDPVTYPEEELLNEYTIVTANYSRYVEALAITENRYYSAYHIGDRAAMELQAEAIETYSLGVTQNWIKLNSTNILVVGNILNTSKLLDNFGVLGEFEAHIETLATQGLTSEQSQRLLDEGLTQGEIDNLASSASDYENKRDDYFSTTYEEIQIHTRETNLILEEVGKS